MLILSFIFFYTLSASVLFLYGIGLERLSMNARSAHVILPFLFKSGILITGAASISWLLSVYLLDPFGLSVLTPLVSLIITYLGERGVNRLLAGKAESRLMQERVFTGGTVLFALYHAFSYGELLIIIISALLSMGLWSFILCAIKRRVDESFASAYWKNAPLLLISMGCIALAVYAWDAVRIFPRL